LIGYHHAPKALLCTLLAVASAGAQANAFLDQFKDPNDGWMDGSSFLLDNKLSFLPVPIIITEPALEGGLGAAGVFFHKRPEDEARESDQFERPSLSAVAAAYTGNNSWLVGGGHLGIWRHDTIQYTGGGGIASINLKYYGTDLLPIEDGLDFNADGFFITQELLFRIQDSSWLIGAHWEYLDTDVSFDLGLDIPALDDLALGIRDSGIGLAVEYGGLDTTFTPSSGNHFRFEALFHDEAIGGDFDYGDYSATYLHFLQLGKFVLGGRAEGEFIDGSAPFFVHPFIDLRGIPALRYQGESVVTIEAEARWDFHPRFSAVGFIGSGWAAEDFNDLGDTEARIAGGIGFRYLFAKLLGLRLGVDVARGPEDTAIYLTIGHNWDT
jgi:hypothetical protein